MLDWRAMLSDLRIPWRDQGRNTSRSNINVCCCFCVDDTGFHLSIAEEKEAFYCYRNPGKHSGNSIVRLLVGLGIPRNNVPKLLSTYSTSQRQQAPVRSTHLVVSEIAKAWEQFPYAHELPRCAHYLRHRGFANPERLSLRYDLRARDGGKWANRVLLPIKHGGTVRTWTGRAVVPDLDPKYDVEARAYQNIPIIYVPDESALMNARRVVIVEGPLDALKVASGSDVASVALGGKNMSPERLMHLRALLGTAKRIDVVLDNDAGLMEPHTMMASLRALMLPGAIRRLRVPREYKDAGDMSEPAIYDWISQTS